MNDARKLLQAVIDASEKYGQLEAQLFITYALKLPNDHPNLIAVKSVTRDAADKRNQAVEALCEAIPELKSTQ